MPVIDTDQVAAVLQSIRYSQIVAKTARKGARGEHVYLSPTGPVSAEFLGKLLRQGLIVSHGEDERRRLTYRLTAKGRRLSDSLPSSGHGPAVPEFSE